MPGSLCPYFWSLVFMWMTIIPYTVFVIPFLILKGFSKTDTTGTRIAMSILLWFITLLLYCIGVFVTAYWTHITPNDPRFVGGGMGAIIAIIIGISIGIAQIQEFFSEKKYKREYQNHLKGIPPKIKQPSIIVTFIKATYNKYCPTINWSNKN